MLGGLVTVSPPKRLQLTELDIHIRECTVAQRKYAVIHGEKKNHQATQSKKENHQATQSKNGNHILILFPSQNDTTEKAKYTLYVHQGNA